MEGVRRPSTRFATVAAALVLCACGNSPAMTDPKGSEAREIAGSWWLLFWLAVGVYVLVAGLIVGALIHRGTPTPTDEPHRRFDNHVILFGGLVLPALVLTVVAVDTVRVSNDIDPSSGDTTAPVQVDIVGERWWWRVDYPNERVVTANEIHVPVDTDVTFTLRSDNVIHSVWVPQLFGKRDMIPGQVNRFTFRADVPGAYRGLCAEFCGIQHGRMQFVVFAETPEQYEQWLSANRADAVAVTSDLARDGEQRFRNGTCAGCHAVRGTDATGTLGPDLTHFAQRTTVAAVALENTGQDLARWLDETQSVKAGALMPELDLSDDDIRALVAYLEELK